MQADESRAPATAPILHAVAPAWIDDDLRPGARVLSPLLVFTNSGLELAWRRHRRCMLRLSDWARASAGCAVLLAFGFWRRCPGASAVAMAVFLTELVSLAVLSPSAFSGVRPVLVLCGKQCLHSLGCWRAACMPYRLARCLTEDTGRWGLLR